MAVRIQSIDTLTYKISESYLHRFVCDTHAPYEEPEGKVEGEDAPEDKLHAFDVQEHFFLRFFSTVLENHHQTIFILT